MRRVLIWRTGCAVLLKTSVEELRIRAFLIVYSEHLTQALIISVGLSQHAKRICEPVSRIAVSQHKVGPKGGSLKRIRLRYHRFRAERLGERRLTDPTAAHGPKGFWLSFDQFDFIESTVKHAKKIHNRPFVDHQFPFCLGEFYPSAVTQLFQISFIDVLGLLLGADRCQISGGSRMFAGIRLNTIELYKWEVCFEGFYVFGDST